jgi:hypothetical protein
MEHRLQLQLDLRSSESRQRVFLHGAEIGVWKDPEPSAARWLIDNGKADRADTLQFYRGDDPALRGQAGWLADRKVREDDTQSPIFAKWKPFPATPLPARTPKSDPPATRVAKTKKGRS